MIDWYNGLENHIFCYINALENLYGKRLIISPITSFECLESLNKSNEKFGTHFYLCPCCCHLLQVYFGEGPPRCFYCLRVFRRRNRYVLADRSGGSLETLLKSKTSEFEENAPLFDDFVNAGINKHSKETPP